MQGLIKSFTVIIMSVLSLLGFVSSPYDAPIDKVNGGDPFIVETESGCYYTFTTGGGIDIFKIKSFDTIEVEDRKLFTGQVMTA